MVPVFPTPSTGKWTKTGPVVDRLMLGNCCNLLQQLAERGVASLVVDEFLKADNEKELEETYLEWNRIVGEKKHKRLRFYVTTGRRIK